MRNVTVAPGTHAQTPRLQAPGAHWSRPDSQTPGIGHSLETAAQSRQVVWLACAATATNLKSFMKNTHNIKPFPSRGPSHFPNTLARNHLRTPLRLKSRSEHSLWNDNESPSLPTSKVVVVALRASPVQPLVALGLGLQATAAPSADHSRRLGQGLPRDCPPAVNLGSPTPVSPTHLIEMRIVFPTMHARPIARPEARSPWNMASGALRVHDSACILILTLLDILTP